MFLKYFSDMELIKLDSALPQYKKENSKMCNVSYIVRIYFHLTQQSRRVFLAGISRGDWEVRLLPVFQLGSH